MLLNLLSNFRKFKKDGGFTLVEIIVVLAIIVSLSSLGYAVYSDVSENQNFNNSYNDLGNILFEAKSSSLSQVDANSTCENNSQNLVGYQINIDSNTNTYSMDIVCATDVNDSNTWEATVYKPITLTNNIGISSNPDNEPIVFRVPNGMVDKEYSINFYDLNNFKTITISTSGAILQ